MDDPGFIFYPGDYLRDTQCLSEKSQVAYDRIMCEHMRNICISQQQLNFFTKRLTDEEKNELMFTLSEANGYFQIKWVAESIAKRRKYIKTRVDLLPDNKSENHWNWQGGITSLVRAIRNSTEMKEWRISILRRDDYTCNNCGKKGGVLHAHHIKSFSKYKDLRFDINNGITLCKACHNNIHSKKQ